MAPDIDAVTKILVEGNIWSAVKGYIENYHSAQVRHEFEIFKWDKTEM